MRNSPGRTLTLQAAYKAKEVEAEEEEERKNHQLITIAFQKNDFQFYFLLLQQVVAGRNLQIDSGYIVYTMCNGIGGD